MGKFRIRHIRKALIPAAGLATRLFPASRAIPKCFLPVVDAEGQIIPLILHLVEEAVDSGIERIGIIVNPKQRSLFEDFFYKELPYALEDQRYEDSDIANFHGRMQKLFGRIEFITQREPNGFGDSIYRAKTWVGGESFLLLLGDHMYRSFNQIPCCRQLLQNVFDRNINMVGLYRLSVEDAGKRGAVAVAPHPNTPRLYRLKSIVEKPEPDYSRQHLTTPVLPEGYVFAFFGCYIFTPGIFEVLELHIDKNRNSNTEIQLTDAMEDLRQIDGCYGYELEGDSLDLGNTLDYQKAFKFLYVG